MTTQAPMMVQKSSATVWRDASGAGLESSGTPVPLDVSEATGQQLRRWSNSLYRQLDAGRPPFGVSEEYARVIAETERRDDATPASKPADSTPVGNRLKVRDNNVRQRFELFTDGTLVAFIGYTLLPRAVRLNRTMVAQAYEGTGLEKALIRHVVLLTHKRRIAVIADCQAIRQFLTDHPQYRQLLHSA